MFAIAIHGGAGTLSRGETSAAQEQAYLQGLRDALDAGSALLERGGSSLDAVTAAVCVLEDNPLFNAGCGAVLTRDGLAELDASIMDGSTLAAGAVCGLKHIRNPIELARRVMEHSPHVMLVGEGAEEFARSQGVELVSNEYFRTEVRQKQLHRLLKGAAEKENDLVAHGSAETGAAGSTGTVGAVAVDTRGNVAAATSTGGMAGASAARVGDSPIVGAGTWADDGTCAVSATGVGEFFVRSAFAHEVDAGVRLAGLDLETSCARALERVRRIGGRGGCIAVDRRGQLCALFDTPAMPRGEWIAGEEPRVAIFMGEDDRASRLGR